MEPGGAHDGVYLMLGAVYGDDRVGADLAYGGGLDVDVRLVQRRVPGAGDHDALAPDFEVRCELAPELRVVDGATHVGHGDRLEQLARPSVHQKPEEKPVAVGELSEAH